MTTNSKVTKGDRDWNGKKLVEFSDKSSKADNPRTNNAESDQKADYWTVDKLIAMSKNLSSAYGMDY